MTSFVYKLERFLYLQHIPVNLRGDSRNVENETVSTNQIYD